MLEKTTFPTDRIRVPAKRAKTLDPEKVTALVEGLHRLEALKALGEETVEDYLAHARLH
ncbi:chromosome partitioning protein ParB [Defluviimonas sp. D31]|uniref:chromosome partitioning protein ParB n=1 Tax=Defluviimonas sp. D31 TaxID=3083253 RepID=UPI00296F6695|nr:chromosome partitioning protein ParB [Defluviimonas sp. D31]MDW4550380.1 chromosome partitioning protein ParB [Defluviimonas sp. D31]